MLLAPLFSQTTQAVMNSARKCALHWRRVVRERKSNNQASSGNNITAPLSLQQQATGPERKNSTMTSDLWNSLARYEQLLQISVSPNSL